MESENLLTFGDILMGLACFFFVFAGLVKAYEREGLVALALVFIGLANTILLGLSRS